MAQVTEEGARLGDLAPRSAPASLEKLTGERDRATPCFSRCPAPIGSHCSQPIASGRGGVLRLVLAALPPFLSPGRW